METFTLIILYLLFPFTQNLLSELISSCFNIDSLVLLSKQQAIIEKFAICEENISQFLKWITEVEYKISSVGGPKEKIDELRNQINLLKVS